MAPSFAHHSFAAEFDANACREFTGTLTKIEWTNPHGFFYMDIKDPDGTVHNWSFQTYALPTLRRAGTSLQLFNDNMGKEVWVRRVERGERERRGAECADAKSTDHGRVTP